MNVDVASSVAMLQEFGFLSGEDAFTEDELRAAIAALPDRAGVHLSVMGQVLLASHPVGHAIAHVLFAALVVGYALGTRAKAADPSPFKSVIDKLDFGPE